LMLFVHRQQLDQDLDFLIKTEINSTLKKAGQSDVKVRKTPLGEKILITASKPGIIVGRKGENIKLLTATLKRKFNLENPQIEIEEVKNPNLDPIVVGERIASSLERFGSGRFKSIGHKVLGDIMNSGALGAELLISGKIPSSRAKTWRFYQGYLKKSGSVNKDDVLKSYTVAVLKTGVIGIQVKIMPSDVKLPDAVRIRSPEEILERSTITEGQKAKLEEAEAKKKPKKKTTKRAKKKVAKKEKSEKNVEAKPEVKTEEKTEAKPEVKAEEKTEVKPEEPKTVVTEEEKADAVEEREVKAEEKDEEIIEKPETAEIPSGDKT